MTSDSFTPMPPNSKLKATRAPVSETYPAADWQRPPPDGASLADFYVWEERRVAAMRAGDAKPFWYLWCPQLSLSVSRREARRLGVEALEGVAEEVAVRTTGGTAVPQGPGTLNITLFTVHDTHPGIRETYEQTCAALTQGFEALGLRTTVGARPGSFCDGDYNLLLDGKKLVGTAQRWAGSGAGAKGRVIGQHHCAVLAGGDPDWLCTRVENLYANAGESVRYDRDGHSGRELDARKVREAMTYPLSRLVGEPS